MIKAKELVEVIKACKASSVSYLKLGDLELKFGPDDAAQTPIAPGETEPIPTAEELKVIEEDAAILRNGAEVDDEVAFMQMEDPVQFEELLTSGELEGVGQRKT
jgi:hypothetical protein